jgi:Cu/Zn superoxide dismutase
MKKLGLLLLLAAWVLAMVPGGAAVAADDSVTVTMNAQNGSGEDGTATITAAGANAVTVVVKLSNGTATAQPAHIHTGSCANLDPTPKYPLTNVVNGDSTTTVNVALSDLTTGGFAINVHKSAAEVSTYVSCGDIPVMAAGGATGGTPLPKSGAGDLPLLLAGLALLALTLMGAGLRRAGRRA